MIKIGVLSVYGSGQEGGFDDRNGPLLFSLLDEWLEPCYEATCLVIPGEAQKIEEKLKYLVNNCGCALVLTLGGTGPSLLEATPDVTMSLCQKILPGFGEAMRSTALDQGLKSAILSRQTAGIYNGSLIINFPGTPGGIKDGLSSVIHAAIECLELLGHRKLVLKESKKIASYFTGAQDFREIY